MTTKTIDLATPEGYAEACKRYGEQCAKAIRFGLCYGVSYQGIKRGVAGPNIDVGQDVYDDLYIAFGASKRDA